MEIIEKAQRLMQEADIDGWLLYDFRRSNSLALKLLKIPESVHLTRRFCYYIPKEGEPIKIVHAIEDFHLDHLPGKKLRFTTWDSFQERIVSVLKRGDLIAMEYSKECAIPYVSKVDAGFMELINGFGVKCVSSQDLLQHFTAVMNNEEIATHKEAADFLDRTAKNTFLMIETCLKKGEEIDEERVQSFMMNAFKSGGFVSDSPPICAFGENGASPHYGGGKRILKPGDPILIDLWCKKNLPNAIYADITRIGFAGKTPNDRFKLIFNTVREAQNKATALVTARLKAGQRLFGYEVDDAARSSIEKAGFGSYFIHRTGHNIHTEPHGDGANMDNFETHDTREVIPGTCFSIEPGIYLPGEFGIRLEYDVLIHPDKKVEVTGGFQDEPYLMDI